MRRLFAIFLGLFLLGVLPAEAQYYMTGSAPASTRWSKISGDHFDIVFPDGLDSLAREYLYSFEKTRTATLTGLHIDTPLPIWRDI